MSTYYHNLSENRQNTTDTNAIIDVLNGATTAICLLPRNCRQSLGISIPQDIPTERFLPIIEKSLQQQTPTNNIWVISIKQDINITNLETKYVYNVLYLSISKQLTDKLRACRIIKAKFYIGLSENENEYPILDSIPLSSHLATRNREGISCPYQFDIYI